MAYKQIRRRTQPELEQTEGASPEINHTSDISHLQTDRDLMTADDALALQDVVGNRATGQLLGATSLSTPPRTGYLQPKPIPPHPPRPGSSLHAPAYAHLRRKPTLQRASWDGSFDTNANFESQVNQQSGGGKPLPSDLRADLEPKFGADFSGVKVHTDAKAAQLSQDVGAQAFTHGSDIYFNQGKYNPESSSSKHLLAHELTHTVQQGHGKLNRSVKPTPAPTIQRRLGRYQAQKVIADNWVFWQKSPQIVSVTDLHFYKNSPPLVLYGTKEEIKNDFTKMSNKQMFIDGDHEIFGQGLEYYYTEKGKATFNIGISYEEVTPAYESISELLDPKGMFIQQFVDGLLAVGGGVGGVFGSGSQMNEMVSMGVDITGAVLDTGNMPTNLKKPGQDIASIGKTKKETRPPIPPFKMVTIIPGWASSGNTYQFNTKTSGVKELTGGVSLPIGNLEETFNRTISGGSGTSIQAPKSKPQKEEASYESKDYQVIAPKGVILYDYDEGGQKPNLKRRLYNISQGQTLHSTGKSYFTTPMKKEYIPVRYSHNIHGWARRKNRLKEI